MVGQSRAHVRIARRAGGCVSIKCDGGKAGEVAGRECGHLVVMSMCGRADGVRVLVRQCVVEIRFEGRRG